ncbi:MAG: hypothetical protein A2542_01385 [Parcubacteria group bacterium RIFOXYD2_FULL_52_8]|nr:MAG: hypothetical protein A2542_01385 [Parcubacteria group bacterium RIFOXYD2_FULL_52_8]
MSEKTLKTLERLMELLNFTPEQVIAFKSRIANIIKAKGDEAKGKLHAHFIRGKSQQDTYLMLTQDAEGSNLIDQPILLVGGFNPAEKFETLSAEVNWQGLKDLVSMTTTSTEVAQGARDEEGHFRPVAKRTAGVSKKTNFALVGHMFEVTVGKYVRQSSLGKFVASKVTLPKKAEMTPDQKAAAASAGAHAAAASRKKAGKGGRKSAHR